MAAAIDDLSAPVAVLASLFKLLTADEAEACTEEARDLMSEATELATEAMEAALELAADWID